MHGRASGLGPLSEANRHAEEQIPGKGMQSSRHSDLATDTEASGIPATARA